MSGESIDPDTACLACGLQSSPETMVICDSCQQGFHLACFGLPRVPEQDEWVCQGCKQLGLLSIGQQVVLEMAQAMYADDDDPHLTQGLFKGSITVLGDIDMHMLPPRREVQVFVEDAPIPGSLMFFSRASFKSLRRVPKESLQLAEQIYQRTNSQLTSVILSSSRWGMFGLPAAAAGRASEAWLSGPDAVQRALQEFQQTPKQQYLLTSTSKSAAESSRSTRVDTGQQGPAQGRHKEMQAPKSAQSPVAQHSQLPQLIQPQHAESQQHQSQAQHYPPAQASSPDTRQLPCNLPIMHGGPLPGTMPYAAQAAMQTQMNHATSSSAYQSWMPAGMPIDQYQQLSHPAHPPWQVSYPYQYYGVPPVPSGPFGWPPMPPSWNLQGPAGGAAGPWDHAPAMQRDQQLPAAGAPYWLQSLTTAAATAAAAAAAAAVSSNQHAALPQQKPKEGGRMSHQQQLVTEAVVRSAPGADEYSSDDDWLPEPVNGTPASKKIQTQKVIYKVLPTPRVRGSRMRINPTLVKQFARRVCLVGVPLWRFLIAKGAASVSEGSKHSSSLACRTISYSPVQLRQALLEFASKDSAHKAFLDLHENRNLPKHLQTLLLVLSSNDDPLSIEADILTQRVLTVARLQGQRCTSVNNLLSQVRSAFRLLFGRCLLPGIESPPTTVKVLGEALRIYLQSPLPDGAVTDFGDALQTRGNLTREPQGAIRTFGCFQVHLMYAWHELLSQLTELAKWQSHEFIPARTLDQVNRWTIILLAWVFRGTVDLGRPSDISLYHLGCFKLVLPDGKTTHLAATVLHSLQQEQQGSLDETLEAFRAAGAVLEIQIPKCKQSQSKRKHNGGQCIEWLDIRKHILAPPLSALCPTRALAFSMAVSWWVRGVVSARLLGARRFESSRAAPKRHEQPDFQGTLVADACKVPTAADVHGYTPRLYLLERVVPQHFSSSNSSESSAGEEAESGSNDEADLSAGGSQPGFVLSHSKPRKGSGTKEVLRLRQLSGYDLRHSLQKDALQTGVPLEMSAKLASHTPDEAKRYSTNTSYELNDVTTLPLKLLSPEWTSKDPVPAPLSPGMTIQGIPYDSGLFSSRASQIAVPIAPSAADIKVSALISTMQDSIQQMNTFIDSFVRQPNLNSMLHGPVLGGNSTAEVLPVRSLRNFQGATHLRAAGGTIAGFVSRLPSISAAGIASPAADMLVRPELQAAYERLSQRLTEQSAGLRGDQADAGVVARAGPQLRLMHFSQVAFGRLDLAWQQATSLQQQGSSGP